MAAVPSTIYHTYRRSHPLEGQSCVSARVERVVVGGEGRVLPERLASKTVAFDDVVVLADDLGDACCWFAVFLFVLPADGVSSFAPLHVCRGGRAAVQSSVKVAAARHSRRRRRRITHYCCRCHTLHTHTHPDTRQHNSITYTNMQSIHIHILQYSNKHDSCVQKKNVIGL